MSRNTRTTSLQNQLSEVCGENSALPFSDEEIEVKSFFLVVFIALVDSCEVRVGDRLRKIVEQSTEQRRSPLAQLDSGAVERAAAGGFVANDNRDYVQCPACKEVVKVDRIAVTDMLKHHSSNCPYPLLCSRSVSRELFLEQHFKSMVEHLSQQWLTTKVTVVLEMGFHPCLVLFALARRRLHIGSVFSNAGELVETLMDIEEAGVERPPVLWDVTLFIKSLEFLRKQPASNSKTRGIPTTLLQEPVGLKAQDRPSYSENSPPNSLGTPGPPTPQGVKSNRTVLVEETLKLIYQWRCKNCFEVDADHLIMDCGHLSLCSACLKIRSCCPICDVKVTNSIRVYGL